MNSVNRVLQRLAYASLRPWRPIIGPPAAILGVVLAVLATAGGHATAETLALTNVRIDTRTEQGVIEAGTVLIRDGVIEAVGAKVEVPDDATVIDGGGATLTPGLIDSQSRLWLTATSRSDTSSAAALRTVDGLDPFDEAFHAVVRQGVTSVAVAPADRGRLGGSVALVAAGPTKSIFDVPSRESFQVKDETEAKKDEKSGKPAPESAKKQPEKKPDTKGPDAKKPVTPPRSQPTEAQRAAMMERLKAARAKAEAEKKAPAKPSDEKKDDDAKKSGDKKDDAKEKKEDDEEIEVPYSITRPPVPYTVGKHGWVLIPDAAVQASLGVAATDGRSRISEFDALKKSLTDAEAYHKKWDEYRSWKAKQDKLPPDQRAKVEVKKPMTMEERRAEFMRRLAAARAARSGATPTPQPKKEPEKKEDEKKDDSKSGDKKEDDKKKDEKNKVVPKPDFDPAKDRLRPILKGEIPIRITVTDNASLKRALELTKIAECQLTLVGVSEVSDEALDEVNWPIIAGPWVGQESETVASWASQIEDGTKRVCIGTFGGSSGDSGTLRMQAAAAVAAGVDPEAVMDAVTRSAAEVMGAGQWLGRIQPGYRADLVLFGGDPLDPATPVLRTMVAGETVYRSNVPTLPQADQQQVVQVDDELHVRLAELSMPTAYILESTRILRPSGQFRPGRVTVVDGVIKSVVIATKDGNTKAKKSDDSLPVLNLGDLVLTPGLVTAHLALTSGSSTSEPDSSYYVAANGLDFQSGRVRELTESGVLFAAVAPPSNNVLAGQIAAARLASDKPILDASIADKLVVASQARRTDRFPASMEGQFEFIRRRFAGEMEPNRTKMPLMVASTMRESAKARFEALSSGKRVAVIEAQTPAELRGSLRLIKALNLDARLLFPTELKSVQTQIEADKLGLIVRPVRATDPPWYLQEIIQAASAGSQIGIAAQDGASLRSTAALMVGQGVKPQRVMQMLTSEAAECSGMPERAATITVGQPADLVIWSGPPYKLTSRCLSVLSDGKKIDQEDRAVSDLSVKATPTPVPAS
ncbi:MAG: amidohydrolase family protein [Planctomycetota bacterium]